MDLIKKEERKRIGKLLFFLILFLFVIVMFSVSPVIAQEPIEDQNLTSKEKAEICLVTSQEIVDEMIAANFSSERINDTLTQAQALYDSQVTKRKTDFSLVIELCDNLAEIKDLAFSAVDELAALKKFYNESITEKMNSTGIEASILEIETEIQNERYEKVEDLVTETYEDIIDLKSEYTALNLFRDYTAGIFYLIFIKHWKGVLVVVIILLIPLVFFRRNIRIYLIKHKMERLAVRRKTLRGLIKRSQQGYFEKGSMSEGSYNIKVKKFAELIRDIDRQIPLLKEELAKLSRQEKKAFKLEKKIKGKK